jgi:subtilase family serine protease
MKISAIVVAAVCISILLLIPVRATPSSGLTPSSIRSAYDVDTLLQIGYTGKGVTVAIIGENIGATFYSDVSTFSSQYGLPPADITVVQPYVGIGTDKGDEITADTELVHAMAPDAKILLVLTGATTPLEGFSYVIDHNAADIATMSFYTYYWGFGAAAITQAFNDEYAKSVDEKITLISISGDFGSDNTVPWVVSGTWTGDFWANHLPISYLMPQYSPYVTIVGGTALTSQSNGYSEVGWSQSGGGPSNLFAEPSWQTGPGVPQNNWRNIPDIALDASCDTPYAFYWNGGQETHFCGTSAAAPTFAGIMADIDQAAGGRVGFLNPSLYSIASTDPSVYYDVTSGCSLVQVGPNTQTGYCAHLGWDFVTGWGSIDASALAKHFMPITPPTKLAVSHVPVGGVMLPSVGVTVLLPWAIALSLLGVLSVEVFLVKRCAKRR